jgi:hypothetical protein
VFSQDHDLWQLPLTPGATPSLLLKEAEAATLSQDGRWMSYMSAASGAPELYTTTFPRPGRKRQVSRIGAFSGGWWTPTELFYIDLEGTNWIVDVVPDGTFDLTIGVPRKGFSASDRISGGRLHPDGKRVLLAIRAHEPKSRPAILVLNWTSVRRR